MVANVETGVAAHAGRLGEHRDVPHDLAGDVLPGDRDVASGDAPDLGEALLAHVDVLHRRAHWVPVLDLAGIDDLVHERPAVGPAGLDAGAAVCRVREAGAVHGHPV